MVRHGGRQGSGPWSRGFTQGRRVLGSSADESDSLHVGLKAWQVVTQEGTVTEAESALGASERGRHRVWAASSEGAPESEVQSQGQLEAEPRARVWGAQGIPGPVSSRCDCTFSTQCFLE